MMDALEPTIAGTLEVLDDLQEDGRRRYVKRRTKEELEEIIVAAWRERDECKKPEEPQSIPAAAKYEVSVSNHAGNVPTTPLKNVVPAYLETDEDERERSASTTKSQKRLRIVPFQKAIAQSAPRLPIGKRKATSELDVEARQANKRAPGPWLRSLKAQAQPTTPVDAQTQPAPQLPIVVYIPHGDGTFRYTSIEDLPMKVHAELLERYNTFRTATSHKIRAHRILSTNPATYKDRPFCVCDQLTQGLKTERTLGIPTYSLGGQLKLRADDKCIRDRIPCTHIVERDGKYMLCFVPLPMKAQQSASWKDLGFWVHK